MEEDTVRRLQVLFPFIVTILYDGLKYLGFRLKPNCHKKEDLNWMLAKLERRVNIWCNRWLSREGRLVLVKSVLEAILVYRMSLAWIPKSILEKSRKICSKFLWTRKKEQRVLPWVKWVKFLSALRICIYTTPSSHLISSLIQINYYMDFSNL